MQMFSWVQVPLHDVSVGLYMFKIQDESNIIALLTVNCYNYFQKGSMVYCMGTLGVNFDSCVALGLSFLYRVETRVM